MSGGGAEAEVKVGQAVMGAGRIGCGEDADGRSGGGTGGGREREGSVDGTETDTETY